MEFTRYLNRDKTYVSKTMSSWEEVPVNAVFITEESFIDFLISCFIMEKEGTNIRNWWIIDKTLYNALDL